VLDQYNKIATVMPKYKVEINGQNFLIDAAGHVAKHGFYTIRFVEAIDPAAAENSAVQMIRETPGLRDLVRNTSDDPPVMDVDQIVELESFDGIEHREPGFVWYAESPRRWWQFWKR
jgi:hypothetical protein